MKFYTHYHHLIPPAAQNRSLSYVLYKVCLYILAAVLVISGIAKFVDSSGLLATLQQVSFMSDELNVLVATLLPIVELGLAAALILQWKLPVTLAATCLIFVVFFIFAGYGSYAGFAGGCGCFGGLTESGFGWSIIARNVIFLSLSVAALVAYNTKHP